MKKQILVAAEAGDIDLHTVMTLKILLIGKKNRTLNLRNELGYSIREDIQCVRMITGRPFAAWKFPKCPCVSYCLVGDARPAVSNLGRKPRYVSLETVNCNILNWQTTLRSTTMEVSRCE